MEALKLALSSIANRRLTTSLTVLSIAMSVALFLGVENVRKGARESFEGTLSQTDLIVGGRGGSLQLLLYSVFHIGTATNNITYETYEHFRNHPSVDWTIPFSLGDSHRGFRVVGTNSDFFDHYRFRGDKSIQLSEGKKPADIFDVVIGSDVAEKLQYSVGQEIVITHGITSSVGIMDHSDKPFIVSGIIKRTATPVDNALYVSLEAIEAIHMDWQSGAPPMEGEEIPANKIRQMQNIRIGQITAFLVRTKMRFETIGLQREINSYPQEPMMAIIPGVTLAEMWRTIGYAETALRLVSTCVIIVGLLGMMISIYSTLESRRREISIFRAVGATPTWILGLLLFESLLLTIGGAIGGLALLFGLLGFLRPLIENSWGILIPFHFLAIDDWIYIAVLLILGGVSGLVPAIRAYRSTLSDGLTSRIN